MNRLFYLCMEDIPLIFVTSGDSSWISGTGEIPQERSDEEAPSPPHGKRPLFTAINSSSIFPFNRTFSVASKESTSFEVVHAPSKILQHALLL